MVHSLCSKSSARFQDKPDTVESHDVFEARLGLARSMELYSRRVLRSNLRDKFDTQCILFGQFLKGTSSSLSKDYFDSELHQI
jgi:hypothetical protein